MLSTHQIRSSDFSALVSPKGLLVWPEAGLLLGSEKAAPTGLASGCKVGTGPRAVTTARKALLTCAP